MYMNVIIILLKSCASRDSCCSSVIMIVLIQIKAGFGVISLKKAGRQLKGLKKNAKHWSSTVVGIFSNDDWIDTTYLIALPPHTWRFHFYHDFFDDIIGRVRMIERIPVNTSAEPCFWWTIMRWVFSSEYGVTACSVLIEPPEWATSSSKPSVSEQ